jgi:hypothetical protein
MKQILFSLFLALGSFMPAAAQNYQVASVIGQAECLRGNEWVLLTAREKINGNDSIRISEKSALSIIDKKEKKIYSFKSQSAKQLANMIKKGQPSGASKFFDRFLEALTRGDTETISHTANVSYKDLSYDKQIYAALKSRSNASAYPVKMCLVDVETGQEITDRAEIGRKFFFRITNHSATSLFVNVLDIAADGSMYDCFPIDKSASLLHLMMPAESSIDFTAYPMEFAEPAGVDRLVLIGSEQPFDLRNIIRLYEENETGGKEGAIGIFNLNINVLNK